MPALSTTRPSSLVCLLTNELLNSCWTVQFSPTHTLAGGCSLLSALTTSQLTAGNRPFAASSTNWAVGTTWSVHSDVFRIWSIASTADHMYPDSPFMGE